MEKIRMRLTAALIATLVLGCAGQSGTTATDAVDDFIVVSELEALDAVRFRDQFNYKIITDEYVVLTSRNEYYLARFQRRCRELKENVIVPDIRFDRNMLRAGIDTIRGCRIDRLFAIDEAQAQELEFLGKRPGA
jgi:hypothetical protein